MEKKMNILLWTLQILLALWNVIGGIFTFSNYEEIKGAMATNLPKSVWMIIAVLQVLFALGLIVPGAFKVMPNLTPISAVYLSLNALAGCMLFAQYSGLGILWGVIPAILCAFIAYGRFVLMPF
jgi:hypothetical protein